jgi:hypothetical protein
MFIQRMGEKGEMFVVYLVPWRMTKIQLVRLVGRMSKHSIQGCQMVFFSNQKSPFGHISEGPGMENVGIFHGHFEYLTALWYIVWPFVTFCDHTVYFSHFGMLYQKKIWQP